jgi:hypothetical protein
MTVRYRKSGHRCRGYWFVDISWPDSIRTRRAAADKRQAEQLDLRIKASCVDGTWKELRRRLMVTMDVPDGLPAALSEKNLSIREFEIPQIPSCVYFLCLGDEVVYVGQSVGLARRVIDHSEDVNKLFDRVFYLLVPQKQLNRIESRFIAELQPRLNRIGLKTESEQC